VFKKSGHTQEYQAWYNQTGGNELNELIADQMNRETHNVPEAVQPKSTDRVMVSKQGLESILHHISS
jgi:hypothetical protein